MSESIPEQVAQIVRSMQDGLDGLATQPEFTEWSLSSRDPDAVIGVTHLRAHSRERERWVCVTRVLGRDAMGEVDAMYSVREVEGGPRLVWRRDPKTLDDIGVLDVLGRKRVSVSMDVVAGLAVLIQGAPPYHPDKVGASASRRPSPLGRLRDYIGSALGPYTRLLRGLE